MSTDWKKLGSDGLQDAVKLLSEASLIVWPHGVPMAQIDTELYGKIHNAIGRIGGVQSVLRYLHNPSTGTCDVCWNSHGCGMPEGHGGPLHHCLDLGVGSSPCSLILWDDEDGWVRWDGDERIGKVRAFHALTPDSEKVGAP